MIVLSSVEVVKELLDKRSAIYSDRPEAYAAKHIPTSKLRIVFMVGWNHHDAQALLTFLNSPILLCGVNCAR